MAEGLGGGLRKAHPLRAIAVLAATWVLLGAAPVSAHEPETPQLFATGDPVTISGVISHGGGLNEITRIDVAVVSAGPQEEPDHAVNGCDYVIDGGCAAGVGTATFAWTPTIAHNGPYTAVAVVSHRDCLVLVCGDVLISGEGLASFTVLVPPAAPTGLNASYADGKVTLTWDAVGPYPDLIGYLVHRKSGSGNFTPIAGAAGESFVDNSPPAGATEIEYAVRAYRPGADGSMAIASAPVWLASPFSEAARAVVPEGASPTTVPGGGSGGGGGSPSANADLGSFFATGSGVRPPSPATDVTLPDTGFNPNLPFPATSKLEGRNPGRPSSAAGSGAVEPGGDLTDSNRRALLIPVAAGSVLCVTALHLRWLSRRLVVSPAGSALGGGDLEPAPLETDFYDDEFAPVPDGPSGDTRPEPVGAAAGGGRPASFR
ncbi:MAG: hypothetical protein ABR540_07870 [Acidimicrobiales bacterium]